MVSNLDILKVFKVRRIILIPELSYSGLLLKYTTLEDIENIQYVTFLLIGRMGLRGLQFYDTAAKKHGQAHMQARYAFQLIITAECAILTVY